MLRVALLFVMSALLLSQGGLLWAKDVPGEEEPIRVVFRFDDYSTSSNTEIETEVFEAFETAKIPVSFGVLPYECSGYGADGIPKDLVSLGDEKANLLRQMVDASVVEVAVHGYCHKPSGHITPVRPTEFAEMPYERQQANLIAGKKILENAIGKTVDVFVPPWNEYDENTLKAMNAAGYRALSAHMDGVSNNAQTLAMIPATTDLAGLRNAIDFARKHLGDKIIVALFHDYDFQEVDQLNGSISVKDFKTLVKWVSEQPDVEVMTFHELHTQKDMNSSKYAKNKVVVRLVNLLPPWIAGKGYGIYRHQLSDVLLVSLKSSIFFVSFGLVGFVVSTFVFRRAFTRVVLLRWPVIAVLAAMAIVLPLYVFRDLDPYFRGVFVSVLVVGAFFGALRAFRITGSSAERAL